MARYTLRQLAYFVAVADAGTISAAAARLHVSATAVAAAIDELERILGAQLTVRRKAHGVTLTPAGSFLRNNAETLLRDADELELSAASGGTELTGPLAIGCYVTVAPTVLPELLAGFSERHPKVKLDFLEGPQDEVQRQLFAGRLDLAVVYDMDLLQGLAGKELYQVPAYVLLPPGHRCEAQATVSLQELADDPLILLDAPPSRNHTLSLFDQASVTPTIRYRTTDFELTRSLVGRNMGYTILVQRPAVDVSYEGRPLVAKPIMPDVTPVGVQIVWPRAVRLTDRAAAMIDFAVEVASKHQFPDG